MTDLKYFSKTLPQRLLYFTHHDASIVVTIVLTHFALSLYSLYTDSLFYFIVDVLYLVVIL